MPMSKDDLQKIRDVFAYMRKMKVTTFELNAFELYESACGVVDDGLCETFDDGLEAFAANVRENGADEFEALALEAEEIYRLEHE